jgi:hypothetical protein
MKNQTMCHTWNGLLNLAVAIGMTALTACTGQETSGEGGGQECKAFLDDAPHSIPIHIVNHRTTSVFLQTQCTVSIFVIDGAGERHAAQLPPLVTTCKRAQEGENDTFGDCMSYYGVFIAPGTSQDAWWDGLVYDEVIMPATCVPPDTTRSCVQGTAPKAGTMTFVVQLTEDMNHPLDTTFELTKSFVQGTDKSIQIDVN